MTKKRRCLECKNAIDPGAHPARKYCEFCRPSKNHRPDPQPVGDIIESALPDRQPDVYDGPVSRATDDAIRAAGDRLTGMDAGAVSAIRFLAKKIDTEELVRERILEAQGEDPSLKPPPLDNVTIPTYLKFAESLGLTPAGRLRIEGTKKTADPADGKRSKLAALRSVQGGRSA